MNLAQLNELGLTPGEIKVYEGLLYLGSSTKTKLVKRAGIAPANLYDITNRLAEKGLISITEIDGVKHFAASNPRNLYDYLDQKREEIDKEQKLVKHILPSLQAIHEESHAHTHTQVFTGWRGMKNIFLDLIEECEKGDLCHVFGASKGHDSKQADRFFTNISRKRSRKGITTQIIFNENMKQHKKRISYFQKDKNHHIKFLDQITHSEVMVYKDTTIIIVLAQTPLAIRIRGEKVATSFREQFLTLWKIARE